LAWKRLNILGAGDAGAQAIRLEANFNNGSFCVCHETILTLSRGFSWAENSFPKIHLVF
jgi:hypothetical protein